MRNDVVYLWRYKPIEGQAGLPPRYPSEYPGLCYNHVVFEAMADSQPYYYGRVDHWARRFHRADMYKFSSSTWSLIANFGADRCVIAKRYYGVHHHLAYKGYIQLEHSGGASGLLSDIGSRRALRNLMTTVSQMNRGALHPMQNMNLPLPQPRL